MNRSRSLARSLLSCSNLSKRLLLLRPAAALSTVAPSGKRPYKWNSKAASGSEPEKEDLGFSEAGWKPAKQELPKPSEIPYQTRVANSVHLVGTIGVPVQLLASPEGVYSAVSVLVHEKTRDSPQFWIPVIFQGDLAQIASSHLSQSDLVYISGQLSGEASSFAIKDAQTNIQILVHSLSFVRKGSPRYEGSMVHEQDAVASHCSGKVEETPSIQELWDDLLANPDNWWDNRSDKRTPTHADFKHKESGQFLWINELTPEWVRSKLDSMSFCQGNKNLWSDLVVNPQQWRDYRMEKLNRSVNPKYPDFKHKDTQKGLWLDRAPEWVLLKLDDLEFTGGSDITNQDFMSRNTQKAGGKMYAAVSNKKSENEKLWKSLVENPNKWWDNRSNKLKPNSPDFKHKDSGEGLWLGSSTPSWVLPNLPQLRDKPKISSHNEARQETELPLSETT